MVFFLDIFLKRNNLLQIMNGILADWWWLLSVSQQLFYCTSQSKVLEAPVRAKAVDPIFI